MASLKKLTELSPLFLCTGGGSVTAGEGWRRGLQTFSSALAGFWETGQINIKLSCDCWTADRTATIRDTFMLSVFKYGILKNASISSFTHWVFLDPLHAVSRHRRRGVQTHSSDSIVVKGDVEPTI